MERYLVFARAEYDQPLEHRGDVEAAGDEEAARFARERYGEDWLEMSLVPVSKAYWAEKETEEGEAEVQV
ncbi:MAG: Phenylacetic acid degradation [Rubrobacteraceae bacterium]|jgi:1,2-phenylacetyl-CoA epoxidase PaaB subunit|nr:Phenylacetic acid degradation [Rubrobacteraceae bacterium]